MNARTPPQARGAAAAALAPRLERLRAHMRASEAALGPAIARLPPARRQAARNLVHYLVLRHRDLRDVQDALAALGLSSLGRAEHDVLATVDALVGWLREGQPGEDGRAPAIDPASGGSLAQAEALLGPLPESRRARIMVTLPTEAAAEPALVRRLVETGMDLARINCGHDGPAEWGRMIEHVRDAARHAGRPCRIQMDLGGPKLRIGPVVRVPGVFKVRPARDAYGRVLRPARVWLTDRAAPAAPPGPASLCLEVEGEWLGRLAHGDRLRLRDARGRKRRWRIAEAGSGGCWAEARKTAYLVWDTRISHRDNRHENTRWTGIEAPPERDAGIRVAVGDRLVIAPGPDPGRPAVRDARGRVLQPARITLGVPEVFRDVRPGEPVSFDDGIVRGRVRAADGEILEVEVTHTRKPVERLRPEKGVNFPGTALDLPALTALDLEHLDFVAEHADIVGLSFINHPEDLRRLEEALTARGAEDLGIVLKIETREGFRRLPELLLEALRWPAAGVMIARGDLAVECGFERLAEVQEEILWLCEAAHLPVIWATQVLEGVARSGHATRAEITDAAMGQAADCVMLNKGAHVVEAVGVLDDILRRMQGHHRRKRSMLRELSVARRFVGDIAARSAEDPDAAAETRQA